MSGDVDDLLELLDLQGRGQGVFVGPPSRESMPRVFGGQIIAQALAAACFTVEPWPCHSLHAYFLRPGKPGRPIDYEVAAMRDGRTFATRKVMAVQRDEVNLELIASFGEDFPGAEYQIAMPDVPSPDSFPAEDERLAWRAQGAPPAVQAMARRKRPIEFISVDERGAGEHASGSGLIRTWMRARGQLASDPNLHRCALAYASDMMLLEPSLRAIGAGFFNDSWQVASLDHALWFHRPFRFDQWLLFASESTSVAGGRGFNRAAVYTADGRLVASIAQEGVLRARTEGEYIPTGAAGSAEIE